MTASRSDNTVYEDSSGAETIYRMTPNQWQTVLRELVARGHKDARDRIARRLTDAYPALNPSGDRDTPVAVPVAGEAATLVSIAIGDAGLAVTPYEEAELAVRKPVRTRSPRAERRGSRECECGCGGITGGGRWLPGHDARYKSSLIKAVDGHASEKAALELVKRGWWLPERANERLIRARARRGAAQTAS